MSTTNKITKTARNRTWMERASCQETYPDAFFPVVGESLELVAIAKRICRSCPVQNECLQLALDNREKHGIWGGTVYEERKEILRDLATNHLK